MPWLPRSRIRRNIPCPDCRYNLRGLEVDRRRTVRCPECGGEWTRRMIEIERKIRGDRDRRALSAAVIIVGTIGLAILIMRMNGASFPFQLLTSDTGRLVLVIVSAFAYYCTYLRWELLTQLHRIAFAVLTAGLFVITPAPYVLLLAGVWLFAFDRWAMGVW